MDKQVATQHVDQYDRKFRDMLKEAGYNDKEIGEIIEIYTMYLWDRLSDFLTKNLSEQQLAQLSSVSDDELLKNLLAKVDPQKVADFYLMQLKEMSERLQKNLPVLKAQLAKPH